MPPKTKKQRTQDAVPMTEDHHDAITDNFSDLCKLNAKEVSNDLLNHGIITLSEMQEVNKDTDIPMDRARNVLQMVLRKEDRAFSVVVNSLRKSKANDLANLLDPPDEDEDEDEDVDEGEDQLDAPADAEKFVSDEPIDVKLKACEWKFFLAKLNEAYSMGRNPRGKALIVNVQSTRKGTNVDCENLRRLLTKLYFKVEVYTESDDGKIKLTAQEIDDKVKDFAKAENHNDSDACVLVLLSHGTEDGLISGTDGKTVSIETLRSYFKTDGHPLKDKPKIMIIQACRGGKAAYVPDALPEPDHFVVCYATEDGFVSWRHEKDGSPFITTLVTIFQDHACDTDIRTMLDKVKDKVVNSKIYAEKANGQIARVKQTPDYKDNLEPGKKLYFFPNIPQENQI